LQGIGFKDILIGCLHNYLELYFQKLVYQYRPSVGIDGQLLMIVLGAITMSRFSTMKLPELYTNPIFDKDLEHVLNEAC